MPGTPFCYDDDIVLACTVVLFMGSEVLHCNNGAALLPSFWLCTIVHPWLAVHLWAPMQKWICVQLAPGLHIGMLMYLCGLSLANLVEPQGLCLQILCGECSNQSNSPGRLASPFLLSTPLTVRNW